MSTERVTSEQARAWALERADDAGRCATDLLDARARIERLEAVVDAARAALDDASLPGLPEFSYERAPRKAKLLALHAALAALDGGEK